MGQWDQQIEQQDQCGLSLGNNRGIYIVRNVGFEGCD